MRVLLFSDRRRPFSSQTSETKETDSSFLLLEFENTEKERKEEKKTTQHRTSRRQRERILLEEELLQLLFDMSFLFFDRASVLIKIQIVTVDLDRRAPFRMFSVRAMRERRRFARLDRVGAFFRLQGLGKTRTLAGRRCLIDVQRHGHSTEITFQSTQISCDIEFIVP